ncbi:Peptide synthetase [Moritella sp. JT01]|uniref:non-ribosomal peptide synthetase n=1 Tax=Moritella sp. JT01 TaxID=756698 RepID=UPI000796F0C6|nr:non-ribosomal peptide synthetase [Moritella sp. JT01]KXO12876.1 Peptide synthetase [Moritella sp. JT01]
MLDLINRFKEQGASLWVSGSELKLSYKSMPDEFDINVVKKRKCDLISLLEKNRVYSKTDFEKKTIYQGREGDATVLSFAQERLLFIEELNKGSDAYHISALLKVDIDVDINILKKAIYCVIDRHPVLNTVFRIDNNGEYYQHLLTSPISQPQHIAKDKHNLIRDVKKIIEKPFNLANEAPMKVHHYNLGEECYVLIIWHHIAFDGWSTEIFMNDLSKVYSTLSDEKCAPLPELSITYGDYAVWQKKYLQGDILKQLLEYWKTQLSGYETLTLPMDRNRPTEMDYKGKDYNVILDANLSGQLDILAKEQGTTLYTVMLSAFYITLSTWSGQDDLIVGTPSDNRHHAQTQSLIGFFVNSLALRCQLKSKQTIKGFIDYIHQIAADAKKHQELPLDRIIDALDIERDIARHPLFQVVFGVQHFTRKKDRKDRLNLNIVDLGELVNSSAKYDLSMFVNNAEENFVINVNYATSLFEDESIIRFTNMYQHVLCSMVVNPHQLLSEIDMLSDQERYTLLHSWNQTDTLHVEDKTIHQLFEEQVEISPDNIAIVCAGEELTYRELNNRANQLAHVIRATYQEEHNKLLQPDTFIALYLDRSMEMVISILAVLKSGGAYIPVSPEYPVDRAQFILEDTNASLLLTQSHYVSTLELLLDEEPNSPIIFNVLELEDSPQLSTDNLGITSAATDLAYIIYTSGTTGKPKGVMIEHKSVIDYASTFFKKIGEPLGNVDFSTNYCFDLSITTMLCPLLEGSRVCIFAGEITDIALYKTHLLTNQINLIKTTPSVAQVTLEHKDIHIKYLVLGGEKLTDTHIRLLKDSVNIIIDEYGPTETTVGAMYSCVKPIKNRGIGEAYANTKLYVLDQNTQITPMGCVGELYIGGGGLARGYLNRPDITAASFIENPFASETDIEKGYNRLYKTGDLVRWFTDGNLEYLGRNDRQTKIRGYRIELSEIETVLTAHENIKQAVVIVKECNSSKYLAAYLVGDLQYQNDSVLTNSICDYLASRLPEYMVPSIFTVINSLPLTINGKLDHRALPELNFTASEDYIAPRTELEAQLCEIWQDVLGLDKVDIQDNFFRIGGDSITAIRLTAITRQRINMDIPISLLFEHKTIANLAPKLGHSAMLIIPKCQKIEPPLSFAQERLLFIEQFEQGSNAYHIPALLQLDDDINIDVLARAINCVATRHPVLNSVYRLNDRDEYYLHLLTSPIVVHSQVVVDSEELRSSVKRLIELPFDLENEAPMRVHHYEKDGSHYLLILWHHIAFDGWSTEVFTNEMSEVYQAFSQNMDVSLPELSISYVDYAVWQRDYLRGDNLTKLLDFWGTQLSSIETLMLPTDKPRPSQNDYKGRNYCFDLSDILSTELRQLARNQDTSLYTVMLSAFYLILSRLSGQDDIVIGTPSDNRHHAQTQSLIGFFVNSLAIRSQVDKGKTVTEYISDTHALLTAAKAHQELPFEQIVDHLKIERNMSHHPLFQVMFSVQNFAEKELKKSRQVFSSAELENEIYAPAKYDISLFVNDGQSKLSVNLNYAVSLFDASSVIRMADMYQRVLHAMVETPSQKLSDIDMLSEHERHTLLHAWNPVDTPYPKNKTVHQLFEEQVDKDPDNIALIFEDEKLTYRELNNRSNQLARVLCVQYQERYNKPLKPGTLIVLYLDRSLDMVISMLAVLKVGGAYVPISPEYPMERTLFMLGDTQSDVILTQHQYVELLDDELSTQSLTPLVLIAEQSGNTTLQPTGNLEGGTSSEQIAYVIYTSGTTGKPKGVLTTHKGVVSLIENNDFIELSSSDVLLHCSSPNFDAATFEIWGALTQGAKLVVVPSNMVYTEETLDRILNQQRITILWLTRTLFDSLFINAPNLFDGLNYLLIGGEALTARLIRQLLEREFAPRFVLNGYGPTESTTFTTIYKCDVFSNSVPIGKPINTRKVYVLDDNEKLLPIGSYGELYIGGAGLALGYLNRPELTAECFIKNPFTSPSDIENGYTRLYKTGDLVRWLPDGNLEYLGRNDNQVKIRGYRIELGEIEAALTSLNCVKQAVVVDNERDGSKSLVAYLVGNTSEVLNLDEIGRISTESSLDIEAIRRTLTTQLPNYMVPTSFSVISHIPLTINGKLDRHALPTPEFTYGGTYVAPYSELEQHICVIWEDVLGLKGIGIYDNFFQIGGDSILSILLGSRLRKEGYSIQAKDIFESPTIHALTLLLENERVPVVIDCEQGTLEGPFDLLPIQQWFFNIDLADSNHFNQSFIMRIPANLSEKELINTLDKLVLHHDILRLRFDHKDEQWEQTYTLNSTMLPLKLLDTSLLSSDELQQQLTDWQGMFNYKKGLLWQVGYLTGYDDGYARLWFAAHHLIIDSVSWRIIGEDISQLLIGKSLLGKTSSYRQWVSCIEEYAKNNVGEREYWHNVLSDSNKVILPSPEDQVQHKVVLDCESTKRLLYKVNRAYNSEINDVLLSALSIGLKKTFGYNYYHINLEGHGREDITNSLDVSRTLGWFTSLYPVRLSVQKELSETLILTKEMLRAIPHKGIGFGTLNKSEFGSCLLPKISFNYLGQLDRGPHESSSLWQLLDEDAGDSISKKNKLDGLLNINGYVIGDQLTFSIESRLPKRLGTCFEKCFKEALNDVIDHCINIVDKGGVCTLSDLKLLEQPPYFEQNIEATGPQWFLLPPGGGGGESYLANLVPKLKNNKLVLFNNIYDNISRLSSSYAESFYTFERLAMQYLQWIKRIQPNGPYYLCGWSFGGVLAFEIARQLEASGCKVDKIILIDPYFCTGAFKASLSENEQLNFYLNGINCRYDCSFTPYETKAKIHLFKAKVKEFDSLEDMLECKKRELKVSGDYDRQALKYDSMFQYFIEDYYLRSEDNGLNDFLKSPDLDISYLDSSHLGWINNERDINDIAEIIQKV